MPEYPSNAPTSAQVLAGIPSGTYVQTVPVSNGTDDTSVINALLAAARTAGGGVVKGTAGQTYKQSAPLVPGSGTTLDMTGCTVSLNSGSNCNMVNNYAVNNPQRTTAGTAMTSGSPVLTTASAVAGDVGRSVVVAGAGPGGAVLVGLVGSVSAGVSASLVDFEGNALNAFATVASASATFYDRDRDIAVIGGNWLPGSNQGGADGYIRHTMRFRHVDNLRVLRGGLTSTGGKFNINPGDCRNVTIDDWQIASTSAPVQFDGPIRFAKVTNIRGSSGDDFFAMGTNGGTVYAAYEDTTGSICDVEVDGLHPTACPTVVVQLFTGDGAGANAGFVGHTIRRVKLNNIGGGSSGGATVVLNSYLNGAEIDDVEIDGVNSKRLADGNTIQLNCKSNSVVVRDVVAGASCTQIVNVTAAAVLAHLGVRGATGTPKASASMVRVQGTVTDLHVSDYMVTLGGAGYVVYIGSTGVVTRLIEGHGTVLGGAGGPVNTDAGATLGTVILHDIATAGAWATAALATTTTLMLSNVKSTGGNSGSLRLEAAANVTVLGGQGCDLSTLAVSTVAGYALRVNGDFRLDLSKITTKSNGDRAYNLNAALACGVGHVVTDGTTWKNLYSGATYP